DVRLTQSGVGRRGARRVSVSRAGHTRGTICVIVGPAPPGAASGTSVPGHPAIKRRWARQLGGFVKHEKRVPWRAAVAVVVVMAAFGTLASTGSAGAQGSVRGFDGTTIKVGSLGIKASLPLVGLGAQARIKRFNDTNEIKGVKLEYTDYADDK